MRDLVYDRLIVSLTARWYRAVLGRLPARSRLLDVGIGTGAALGRNEDLLRERALRVLGIDIDPDYVAACRRRIAEQHLGERVEVRLCSVYDLAERPFDAVYFSASFMLLPDPRAALAHVRGLLAPGGRVYFTQTFEERRSALVEWVKPRLHRLTTIRFGKVTYREGFLAEVEAGGFRVVEEVLLTPGRRRTGRLFIAEPRAEPAARQ